MSYYGYPNAQAYGANYAQYAAAYAAQSGSFDHYQAAAAYNAAAYNAMQIPATNSSTGQAGNGQPKAANGANGSQGNGGISISGTPQRYDYTGPMAQAGAGAAASGYEAAAYASNMMSAGVMPNRAPQHNGPKWGQLPGQSGANKFNKAHPGGGGQAGFHNNRQRRNPTGQPVQVFYCEVCKISCAGPQTYKEHLDGQKHKKRETANKINEEQALAAATGAPVTSDGMTGNVGPRGQRAGRPGMPNSRGTNSSNLVMQCALCDVACTGKDAYSAHVRGAKHQKTIKLHQKLGKPIPPDAFDTIAPVKTATTTSENNGQQVAAAQAAVITAPPQINMSRPSNTIQNSSLIGPIEPQQQLSTVGSAATLPSTIGESSQVETNEEELVNIEPVGKEYIETKLEGKILSFYCKLCECQFNDPNAKDMHTKGRRHRLAYKKKVDPSLRVDMKGSSVDKKQLRNSRELRVDRSLDNRGQQAQVQQQRHQPMDGSNNDGAGTIKPLMGGSNSNNIENAASVGASAQGLQQLMATQYNQYQVGGQTSGGHHFHSRYESFDDKHIIAKHNGIYPTQDEIQAIQEIVSCTEKALKLVSDQIADEDHVLLAESPEDPSSSSSSKVSPTKTTVEQAASVENSKPKQEPTVPNTSINTSKEPQMFRALKGVMRVGLLAKGLLLKGDTDVQLIVLCAQKPTKSLLERVYSILLQKIDVVSPDVKYSVILDKDAETIVIIKLEINDLQPLITCKILLTSPTVRTDSELKAAAEEAAAAATASTITPLAETLPELDSEDLLNKQRCLESLASLRHAKWFQARASNIPNCVVIIRVLRDLCRRNSTWTPLTQWGLELLVEKSLSSAGNPLSAGEAMRRVLECVSSGVLLPDGPGLHDPCEKEPTDVSAVLSDQQREELTSSAQMALRLLAFKQVYKILGIECITYNTQGSNLRTAKKRPNPSKNETDLPEVNEKKIKDDTVKEECDEQEKVGSTLTSTILDTTATELPTTVTVNQ